MVPNPKNYSVASIPDLAGKTYLVTGGNSGVGYETCLELARKNASVILAARSEDRAKQAIEKIQKDLGGNAKVEFLKLDLMDLKQIRSAAEGLVKRGVKLDVLVNNAGIMATPFELSKDGIESQFATNHVGHYLFTREVLPLLFKSSKPRIVNISSSYHKLAPKNGGILFDQINDPNATDIWGRYGQTKLANILFSRGLHKRYADKGLLVNSVHPGFVKTELTRGVVQSYGIFSAPIIGIQKFLFAIDSHRGALTQLYAATAPEIESENITNKFFVPIAMEETPIPYALDDALADKLWDFTEKLVNEKLAA